jgi:hypothetical protein
MGNQVAISIKDPHRELQGRLTDLICILLFFLIFLNYFNCIYIKNKLKILF